MVADTLDAPLLAPSFPPDGFETTLAVSVLPPFDTAASDAAALVELEFAAAAFLSSAEVFGVISVSLPLSVNYSTLTPLSLPFPPPHTPRRLC